MATVSLVLFLFLAVVVSSLIYRLSSASLPLPLVQICVGAGLTYTLTPGFVLQPDIFFFLFLPPLLFLDGWRIPKLGFFRDFGTILALAIGLVVFTVLGVGPFIHWLIPSMPLPVAFALAAVLSPTDPIAVSSVAMRLPIPHRLMHILQGESLLNDASGLVCLRFAVAAALTGSFSPSGALLSFAQLALGGVAVGAVIALAVGLAEDWLLRRIAEDPGTRILVGLLVPFGAYLAAEHLQCSGVLAAASAGIVTSYVEFFVSAAPATRIRRRAVWETVQSTANGVIFVLLGGQLPEIFGSITRITVEARHPGILWLPADAIAITVSLIVLRTIWVWLSLKLIMFRRGIHGTADHRPSWRLLATTSLAGAKGAVTMAGILTLPLATPDGTPFPARTLAIFIAMTVVLLSIIAASLGLPQVLRDLQLPPPTVDQAEEWAARRAADTAAIKAIERASNDLARGHTKPDLYAEAVTRAMEPYRRHYDVGTISPEEMVRCREIANIERRLRIVGLRAERDELYRLRRKRQLGDMTLRRMVRTIDLTEARYTAPRR